MNNAKVRADKLGDRLRRVVVNVTFFRRIDPSQAGDEYRDEQGPRYFLEHAYAARLACERRHISEARAGERGDT